LPVANGGTGISAVGAAGNVLTSDGTTWVSSLPASGGMTYTTVKTANFTASANTGVQTNTSGGAFTVTLPASPAVGAQVVVVDSANSWATNNLTVGRNGSTIEGDASDLICDISGVSVQFIYNGTTWDVFAQVGGAGSAAPSGAVSYPQNIQSGDYTLVLSDAGKHIYSMNSAPQTITIPTNASVAFPIGSVVTIINRGTASITLETSGISIYNNGDILPIFGIKTIPAGRSVQIIKTGEDVWDGAFGSINGNAEISYLNVGGGGGGGTSGGGGGAGGFVAGQIEVVEGQVIAITVGAGGAGGSTAVGVTGSNSTITGITTALGGGGGGYNYDGLSGGSGGGARYNGVVGSGTSGQGNNGGLGVRVSNGGGGGGAGAVGGAATGSGAGNLGGVGGAGLSSDITGSTVFYAGGGGGGTTYTTTEAAGGIGGGGTGGDSAVAATSGASNTGGGGGGSGSNVVSGNGGSGVVILSIPTAFYSGITTGSPVITTSGSNTIMQFNSSGSYTV
jgi:hypothetical protein